VNVGLVWASAHTTHFAKPGWQYLVVGEGSGLLAGGGSFVTLTNTSDFAIIIEKMAWDHSQCIRPGLSEYDAVSEEVTFTLTAEWASITTLYVWQTVFGWQGNQQTNSSFFQQLAPITVVNGSFTITVNPDELYTITTITTSTKADIPTPPASQPFPSPYSDDFESYNISSEAAFFADQAGSFEIVLATNTTHGKVMRQAVPSVPICWSGDFAPFTIIGDTQWSDTVVSAEVLIETTGAAYVGARSGGCCVPGGLFLAVSVDSQKWSLNYNIDVENPSTALLSGAFTVTANTWYNLSLSVIDNTVNAWIGSDQVVNGYTVGSISSGWAVLGSSVQAGKIYTFAQFDNFQVVGERLQCQTPAEGTPLTVINCGGLNGVNSQWLLQDGYIKLKSNPTLCATGSSDASSTTPITLAACEAGNPTQLFEYVNSTSEPYSSILQGAAILAIDNNAVVLSGSSVGSGVVGCDSSDPNQNISFTGSSSAPGQIKFGASCLSGTCSDSKGCYPLQFIPCNEQDTSQLFTFTSNSALVVNQNSYCLDVYGQTGPAVGAYPCDGGGNEQWTIGQDFIEVKYPSGQCLSNGYPGNGAQVMVNEFGNGELTFYGPFVTDQCIGVCTLG
jgi:hypothetical protein